MGDQVMLICDGSVVLRSDVGEGQRRWLNGDFSLGACIVSPGG